MTYHRFLFVVLTYLILGGCAANVSVHYTPDPAHKSPLETLKPMAISVSAVDLRDEAERDRVGNRKNGFGDAVAPVVLKGQEPVALVQEALKQEFTNNGIQIVESTSAVPHKAITAKLKKYWVENRVNLFNISMYSTISADIVIDENSANGRTSTHSITGAAEDSRQFAFESAYEETLNDAMREFIHNFSRDPAILSSLKGPR